jgi:hypothetical protein
MDEDGILARVVHAVQEARSAFQDLCSGDHKVIHAQDSPDLLDFDVDLHALGSICELLNGIDPGDHQFPLINSILAAPVNVSTSGNQMPMANAMIADMRNLKLHLVDVRRVTITTSSSVAVASVQRLTLGEAMSIRRMVKKYHSIISETLNSQILCAMSFPSLISILIS